MNPARTPWLYRILKPLVRLILRLFYRNIHLTGTQHIPLKGPVILIANHQNALLDPVVCSALFDRDIHWLTRADVFRNPIANRLLRMLNMLPVYRERDKTDLLRRNEETFQVCEERLASGEMLALFPEGSHHGDKYLRPFRKGLARIVIRAMRSGAGELKIVPVGIDYSHYRKWGADLVIAVGEPLDAGRLLADIPDADEAAQLRHITRESELALRTCMIHIPDSELSQAIAPLAGEIATVLGLRGEESRRAFEALRQISSYAVGLHRERDGWIRMSASSMALPMKPTKRSWLSSVMKVLLFPAHVIVFPFRRLVVVLSERCTSDPQFTGTFRLVLGTLLFPVYGLLAFLAVFWLADERLALCLVGVLIVYVVVAPKLFHAADMHPRQTDEGWIGQLSDLVRRTRGEG